jgi:hypothetical protein
MRCQQKAIESGFPRRAAEAAEKLKTNGNEGGMSQSDFNGPVSGCSRVLPPGPDNELPTDEIFRTTPASVNHRQNFH